MSQPYIPFYTSDFLAGTGGMTAASKGVYITLLCLMYEAEGPLPQKWDTLARRCGASLPAFKRAVQDLCDDGKLTVSDEGIWSEKCEKHIAQRGERQSSAKAAAEKRWEKAKQKQGKAHATASIPQCQPEPEPEPEVREKDTYVSLSEPAPANPVSQAVSEYNAAAEQSGWPKVQKLTPQRSKMIRARLSEVGGVEGWQVALRKAQDSDFLCGRTRNPWAGFGFDWITKQANFTKLMEGNYDNRSGAQGHDASRTGSGMVDAFAAVAARYEQRAAGGSGNG